MPSFDVVSQVDTQEVDNAVNQARKEINTRYDFRGSKCKIDLEENTITLHADDKMKLEAMQGMLREKMAKRGISARSLEFKEADDATGGTYRQIVTVKQGIEQEEGRKIVKLIKDEKLKKVQAQIQQDQVRVTGAKRDDLQGVIALLKEKVTNLDLQFVNFRD